MSDESGHVEMFTRHTGDQAGTEAGPEVLLSARYVVQVSAGALLWAVVHLPAHLRAGGVRQGAGSAHGVRSAEAHGDAQGGAAR